MKYFLFISTCVFFIACRSNKTSQPVLVNVTNDIVIPKHYIISKTTETMNIDGKAYESCWKHAPFTKNFIDIEGLKTPKFNTKVKMLWNNDYIYLYAELNEPHIWATLKQRDTIIFYNNDFEIFLDPSGTGAPYGEIEINALNTIWDLQLDKAYRVGGNANFNWNLTNLKSAVQIYGTLNNPKDIDSLWAIEMAIPIKPLMALKPTKATTPKEGEQWRINFSRVEWDHDINNGQYSRKKENNTFLKEYNWVWSNQKVINMHEPEKWGFLQFTNASSSKHIEFIEDIDLAIKQTAYALFRRTKYGDLKYLLNNKQPTKKSILVTYNSTKTLNAFFKKNNSNFSFQLKSPLTNIKYLINQNGTLKKL